MGTALLASVQSPCFAPFSCLSPACWPSAGTWMTCTPGVTSTGTSLAFSLQNALTGLFCDMQSSNLQFGDFENPQVIGDGTDDNSNLISTIFTLHFSDQSSDRNWGSVDLGHK